MQRPAPFRSRFALLPLALLCAGAPQLSVAATASATELLSEMEAACTPVTPPTTPPPSSDDFSNNNDSVILPRAAAKSASASPDSPFCSNLLAATAWIDRENGNDEAARLAARADLAAEMTPDEMPALYTSLVQLSANQIRNVSQHLRGQRYSRQRANTDTTASAQHYQGGNAGDALSGRFSLFVDGANVAGEQDQSEFELGYDLDTDHYTIGTDYRISDSLVAGFAYGSSDTTLEYSEAQNRTDNSTDHYILYSSWYQGDFAVDTLLAYASGEFDTQRHVQGSTALGNTDNSLTYVSLAGSYDFVEGSLTWGTFASFDYLDGQIDAFEESSNSGWEVAFSEQDVKSQIYAMGVQGHYAASFGWGVLVPHARVEWRTELEDERSLITGRFVQDPASSFALTADDPDAYWYQVSAGLSAQFAHGIAIFADYEEVLDYEDAELRTVTAGIRLEL